MSLIQEYLADRKRESTERMEACRVIPSLTREGLSYYPDISYLRDGLKAHKMDMYCPRMKGPLPVIINVHGDPISGRKEANRHFCMNLCKQGYIVFSVNYQLKPEASLRDQIQDLADASAYIQNMSIELKMQSDNLFFVGDQGGAMLIYYLLAVQNDAALARLLGIQPAPISFCAAAYISGPIYQKDFRQRLASLVWEGREKFRGYQFLKTDNPSLVDHQPPTLFFTSCRDDGYYGVMKLAAIFEEKERPVQVIRFDRSRDYYTGFCVNDPELPESVRVLQEITSFFREQRANKTYE